MSLRESGRQRVPVLNRSAEAVHENERRPAAVDATADGIAKPSLAHVELALLESLQSVFAVRHQ